MGITALDIITGTEVQTKLLPALHTTNLTLGAYLSWYDYEDYSTDGRACFVKVGIQVCLYHEAFT